MLNEPAFLSGVDNTRTHRTLLLLLLLVLLHLRLILINGATTYVMYTI